jgi:peroxiredoxin Q/BCP
MAQLRQDYDQFKALNAEILVIGPENARAFEQYWTEHHLPFTGLPDPQHSVLKRYGQEINLFKFGRMPAMILVDAEGVARFVHYGHSMSDIPANEAVLEAIRGL